MLLAVSSASPAGPENDAFYALLHSANVIGVAHMLMAYPNALGRKTVKNITAYRKLNSDMKAKYYLWIEVERYNSVTVE